MQEKKEIVTPQLKSFNAKEFIENVKKGAVIGSISTTATFFAIDKPLSYATKAVAETFRKPSFGFSGFIQELRRGNFSICWNNSLYATAYRSSWQHPVTGYPVALLNSCTKNIVFFPTKYATESVLSMIWPNEQIAQSYSGFLAGIGTVYVTTPISVLKTRMMTNVSLDTLSVRRLMSGVNAIAIRDGIQFGVYFNVIAHLKAQFGDNVVVAGAAGILGYLFSNPFSVIGLNQKTSVDSLNIVEMTGKIYKSSGVRGFYPLIALSAFGMFARGIAINEGAKLYESLAGKTENSDIESGPGAKI
ncbi:MC/SLC25 family protein [Legionella brunensis]|uniref:Mitochondrial carrier protein n=1 Tax=Legionella brunensis TaxID=29422 RepID=A0A0W0SDR3_9GAMM|nr:MC/SLC25 family protein [Legionella brunensis]KTC81610.1 hypothetical protein Lbru_2130 [Legionella brunensis]